MNQLWKSRTVANGPASDRYETGNALSYKAARLILPVRENLRSSVIFFLAVKVPR